ncbi:uncharacterized protein BDW70DRAFT_153464 [Aspergillus foveolatus]|uniref:uncharacterized protein n=1 Tax=Aspergillus foveolatus TaxID=210207 RepID=UPI003CCCC03F
MTQSTVTGRRGILAGRPSGSSPAARLSSAIAAAHNDDTVVATSRDVSKLADLIPLAVIDGVEASIGPIDILVNNAGYILEGAVEECSDDEILAQFNVNFFSQIRLRAVLPSMRARRAGVIANLGSIAGWDGTPAAGFYCASKAAIAIYTESLRHEVAPLGIDVTCIEPGYFRTNFLTTSGGHKVTARKRINDLQAGTQQARDALVAYGLHQPGDPIKGARVIVEALTKTGRCEGRSLPGRLAFGPDAMATIGESMKREQEMMGTWRDIISSTDCDDVWVKWRV